MGQIVTVFFFLQAKRRKVSNLHHGNWIIWTPALRLNVFFQKGVSFHHIMTMTWGSWAATSRSSAPPSHPPPRVSMVPARATGMWPAWRVMSPASNRNAQMGHPTSMKAARWAGKRMMLGLKFWRGSWVPSHLRVSVRKQQVLRETW